MSRRTIFLVVVIACALGASITSAGSPQGNRKEKPVLAPAINQAMIVNNLKAALGKLQPGTASRIGGGTSSLTSSRLPAPGLLPQNPLSIASTRGSGGGAIVMNDVTGIPRKIEITPQSGAPSQSAPSSTDALTSAQTFLSGNSLVLKIKNPESEFALMTREQDEQGLTHVRLKQLFAGLEVWASDVYVHVGRDGAVTMFNGTYHPTPDLGYISPGIGSAAAVASARNDLSFRGEPTSLPPALKSLLKDEGPAAREVVWYDRGNTPHLAWFVEMRTALDRDWYYFVDAGSGKILHSYNNVMDDGPATGNGTDLNSVSRSFGTYAVGSTYYMVDASEPMYNAGSSQIPQNPVGAIAALDLRGTDYTAQSSIYFVASSNNTWPDRSSVSALYNAGRTYNFYRSVFGRNSIDDKGMTIYSIIHVTSNGQAMDNAYWSGGVMCYGDGNTAFKPLAGGFDVAAHEMTHGVTQHTANLTYQDQSGALNESMSDVMAAYVDSANWTIGEQVIKDLVAYPSGALRDLSNPHNGGNPGDACWQPATMAEFINTTQDHGGVHGNSGIPNNAFYRVATAVGRPAAGAIWYRALTHYLTSSAQFVDARIATEAATKELYGDPSPQMTAVKNAWDAVQVFEGTGTHMPPPTQLTGDNWVLVVNTAVSDPNSIYMVRPVIASNGDFSPLSTTPVANRPAVSDTSGLVLFVDTNHRLRALIANAQNPDETYIDTNSVWGSVAIGPGLSSLALTSRFVDTTIYYFDLQTNQSKQFKIQTMAYDGTYVRTALYADALSFDPTGRYLLFDSFNETKTVQGATVSFWEIDMLEISTGIMRSVFAPQPSGIDVGNPAFAKTSPYRFAFDYWDANAGTGKVLATNLFTGATGVVVAGLPTVGFPTYSGNDDTIAFHSFANVGGVNHDAIQKIGLDTSRIVGQGSPQNYLVDATFPVWFVIGRRTTGVGDAPSAGVPQEAELEQNYPNPFNPSTTIRYALPHKSQVLLTVFNTLGQQVATLVDGHEEAGSYEVKFDGSGLASGVYFYRLQAGTYINTKKLLYLK